MKRTFTLGTLVFVTSVAVTAQTTDTTASLWRSDLEQLTHALEEIHPDPFVNINREEWGAVAGELDARLNDLTFNEFGVALQQLVALLGDAHTSINPLSDSALSTSRYPVSLYLFEDGLYVRAAAPGLEHLVGGRVLAIGRTDPGRAITSTATTISYENTWWIRAMAPERLVVPEVLDGLGIADTDEQVELTVEREGRRYTEMLVPVQVGELDDHHGLARDTSDWTDMMSPETVPLWQKHPHDAMWYEWLPDTGTLYVCYRAVSSDDGTLTNEAFWSEVFALADSREPRRFVIDIRENSGGNGMLNRNVVQQIVRRPDLDRSDRFYVIIGRRTFSAAQQLANQLDWWTQARFVGEPTGQRVSQYGDAKTVRLDNSRITVNIATRFHQGPNPLDVRDFIPPDVYAPLTSADYINGVDPALEAVIADEDREPVMARVIGALQAGQFDRVERLLINANMDPVNRYLDFESDINGLGYDLLSQGQTEAAIALFEINTRVYPVSANTYDSLGEALVESGRIEEAIVAYRKALEIDPSFPPALEALRQLQEGPPGH